MGKNKRVTKDKMFQTVEAWQKSGQAKDLFCKNNKCSKSTFYYWLKKYREENRQPAPPETMSGKGFLPVKISGTAGLSMINTKPIDIYYPNGVRVNCPANLKADELRTLINL